MIARRVLLSRSLLAAFLLVGASPAAFADIVQVDNFSVTGSVGTLFNDTFNGGTTLNPGVTPTGLNLGTSPPVPASYNVTSNAPIIEANGVATLNTATGLPLSPIGPVPSLNQVAVSLLAGLSVTGNFSTTGIFNLSLPSAAFNSYGVELIDLNAAHNGNITALRVVKASNGDNVVSFLKLDPASDTSTIIGSALLDATHDQILLELSQTAGSSLISASYGYLDNGVGGPLTTFSSLADVSGDDTTARRAAFTANAAVPEPGVLSLFLGGLAFFGWTLRRRSRDAA